MSFTSKKLHSQKSGMGYIKGATLFFLGMSCVLFMARAFDISPTATNAVQYIQRIFLTQYGDSNSPTEITLDGTNGNGTFAGSVGADTVNGTTVNGTTVNGTTLSGTNIKGTTITGSTICLANDTSATKCRTSWPTVSAGGGASLWSTGTTANKIYYTSGNVGIGLVNPLYPLQVSGTLFANTLSGNQICLGGVCQTAWPTGGPIIGGDSLRSSGTNKIYYTSGNVGIGTNSPGYPLEISGDVKIQNTLHIGDFYYGKIYVDTNSALNIEGFNALSNIKSGKDIYINGGCRGGDPSTVDGNVLIANKQGNVGIGTATPSAKFQVGEYAWIGQNYTAPTTGGSFMRLYGEKPLPSIIHSKYTPNIQLDYYINNFMTTPTVHNWQIDASDTLNFNYANGDNNYTSFMKITSAGNVGIGTATTTEKLTVNGGIGIHGNGSAIGDFELYNNTSTTTLEGFMGLYHVLGGWATPWVTTVVGKNGLFLSTSASIDSGGIFISTGGNVGIGTATPTAKLEVNGDIKIAATSAGLGTTKIYKSDGTEHTTTSGYPRCGCDTNPTTGSDCSYTTSVCYDQIQDLTTYPFTNKYIYYTLEQGYACTTPGTIIYEAKAFWGCSGWTKENPALPTGMFGWKQLDI